MHDTAGQGNDLASTAPANISLKLVSQACELHKLHLLTGSGPHTGGWQSGQMPPAKQNWGSVSDGQGMVPMGHRHTPLTQSWSGRQGLKEAQSGSSSGTARCALLPAPTALRLSVITPQKSLLVLGFCSEGKHMAHGQLPTALVHDIRSPGFGVENMLVLNLNIECIMPWWMAVNLLNRCLGIIGGCWSRSVKRGGQNCCQ